MDLVIVQVSSSDYLAAKNSAVQYLESHLSSVSSDPYALSIITYALTLAGSSQANNALQLLNRLAITKGTGTYYYYTT